MKYIVKFGEAFLKSKSTRKKFVKILIENLKKIGVKNIAYKNAYLLTDTNIDVNKIKNVFGVQKIEIIKYEIRYEKGDIDIYDLFSEVLDKIANEYIFSSFRITAKRENKTFPVNSQDLQMILGKYISKKYNKIASYKDYELEIKIRVLKDEIWIWTNKDTYFGVGGLPYGIEGKALNMFSGGIDSPVATFLIAKRGVKQDFLFLNIPNSDLLLKQVFEIYNFLKDTYGIEGRFYVLNFGEYIWKIKEKIPSGYRQIVFKTLLYKIADKFAQKLKVNSLVLGENLGQVSTQTLINMELLDKQNDLLNLRPLLCFDKTEIIHLAKKVGTYEFSEKIKETCSLESNSNARIKDILRIEKFLQDLDLNLDNIVSKIKLFDNFEPEDIEKFKVQEPVGEIIDIEKNKNIPTLDKNKSYTFVCSSGYKASQKAKEYRKKGYDVYFKSK